MRTKTRHNSIQVFALIIAVFMALAFSAIASPARVKGAELESSGSSPVPGAYCTGSPNIDHGNNVVRTGGPLEVSVGQKFEALSTVFNRTNKCRTYTVTIMMGGSAWKFPGGASTPRVTKGTIYSETVAYDDYIVSWFVMVKPNSHVNFYQGFEPSGTAFGPAQVIEIYLGNLGDVNKPHSAWAVRINQ